MESRTPEERRARFMTAALPIGMVSLFVLAVGGFLLTTWMGGEASGERVEMRWSSSCPEEWARVAGARGKEIGLGGLEVEVEASETLVRATLPGNEDDLQAIPALIAGDGRFAVYEAESLEGPPVGEALVTNVDITSVWFNIDYSGHAYAQVEVQPKALERVEASTATLIYMVDEAIVSGFQDEDPADADDLRLQDATAATKEDEVRSAIDWKILIDHGPAPCERGEVELSVLSAS